MIKVLDSFVADKIAAGEVIERPVSAIKELVENSIDAGAGSIIIEIRNGGKSYIRVTDDGCGISSGEAETAFLRHATSKISSVSDLDGISSLGFRGEALASICAVSRLTMVSRTADQNAGTKLVLHGGRVVSNDRTGANQGTTMIAEDLFYNTPARRKFMKSDAREASAVIELIQQLAVCYPQIRFMMISNGSTLFSTAGDGDTEAVIRLLYPEIAGIRLLQLDSPAVSGFIAGPGSAMSSRKFQLFFVNGRLVSSNAISKGLTDGYRGRIFSGFPPAFLFIDADPHEIDVNIHPGKREIRFLNQDGIIKDISDAVSAAVMTEEAVPEVTVVKNRAQAPAPDVSAVSQPDPQQQSDTRIQIQPQTTAPASGEDISEQTSIRDYLTSLRREEPVPGQDQQQDTFEYSTAAPLTKETSSVSEKTEVYRPFDFNTLEYKGYIFDTYIIMQCGDTVYVFDQHAAHERVFYEKFMDGYKKNRHLPQPVLTAFTLNVSADVYSMEDSWLDDVRAMGYDISDFGQGTFIIRGVPSFMSVEESERFIRAYAESLDAAKGTNDLVIDKLIMKSCKSAVKGGDHLSELEIRDLMAKLSECDNPFSCPHGRPTFIKLSKYDIERTFHRK